MVDPALVRAFDANTMDVNEDGKKDVVISIFQLPDIYWYEQPAASTAPWIQHAITTTYEGTDLYTGDIDGDKKTDLIISGLFTNKIYWFSYQLKNGEALWTDHVLDDDITMPGDISLNDMDGDGDLDVVLAGMGVNQIIWYENQLPSPCTLTVSPGTLRNGVILPRIRTFTITGTNSNWGSTSTVAIQGINTIIPLSQSKSEIRVLALVPAKMSLPAGNKAVTVTTGDEICTGNLVIE
jgi:hypothetical protein